MTSLNCTELVDELTKLAKGNTGWRNLVRCSNPCTELKCFFLSYACGKRMAALFFCNECPATIIQFVLLDMRNLSLKNNLRKSQIFYLPIPSCPFLIIFLTKKPRTSSKNSRKSGNLLTIISASHCPLLSSLSHSSQCRNRSVYTKE